MAITQNPITGRSSGKFSTAIFSTLYGQNIIRSKPVNVRTSTSDAVVFVRQKFAAVALIIKQILPLLKQIYSASDIGKGLMGFFVGKAYTAAAGGALGSPTVDYSKVLPGNDTAGLAGLFTGSKSVADKVSFTWDETAVTAKIGALGTLGFVVIDDGDGSVYISPAPVAVAAESVDIVVPGTNTGKTFSIYICPKSKVVKFKAGSDLSDAV